MMPIAHVNGFREWPSIEFPQWLRELGFEDQSYHNDLCARAVRPLEGYTVEEDFPCIVVWCEHEKLEDREFNGTVEDMRSPRFHAQAHVLADVCSDNSPVTIYEGDDPVACRAALLALHGRVIGASDDGACLGSIVRLGQKHIVVLFDSEEWRDYEDGGDGGVLYRLTGEKGEWATSDGSSVVHLIDLMEVKK